MENKFKNEHSSFIIGVNDNHKQEVATHLRRMIEVEHRGQGNQELENALLRRYHAKMVEKERKDQLKDLMRAKLQNYY